MLDLLNNLTLKRILSEEYYVLLKNGVYKNLVFQKSLQELLNTLTEEDLLELKKIMKTIPNKELNESYFHGISHVERTVFWTYLLSEIYLFNTLDKQIVLDAAKYHDIGRTGELEDRIHGRLSAEKVGELLNDSIYAEKENKALICASIELHSLDDSECNQIMNKYGITDSKRFSLIWKILKDADALDRVRLTQGMTRHSGLNPDYLRLTASKYFIKASHELCKYYNLYEEEKERVAFLS